MYSINNLNINLYIILIMPKNAEVYDVLEENEKSCYDILLCRKCRQTVRRCNFPRHKKTPRHKRDGDTPSNPIAKKNWNRLITIYYNNIKTTS